MVSLKSSQRLIYNSKMSDNLRPRILRVEWSDEAARVTRIGGLACLKQYLDATDLFEHLVEKCPLSYEGKKLRLTQCHWMYF
jgi:hypothetical protein